MSVNGDYNFIVNGELVSTSQEANLMNFLRDDKGLISVKNGCATGVCGACTVLVNGKPARSCTLKLNRLEGKSILTVEGLSEGEKQLYTYVFGKAGAVQCGFCTPGMVLCAKALLDANLNPSEEEVRQAFRNNLCRCTGYVKIFEAVRLAASILRGEEAMATENGKIGIGSCVQRSDVEEKVRGTAIYCDDVYLPDMLFAKVLRTEHPRAKILSIDTEVAKSIAGVHAVITASDIPGSVYSGYVVHDWPVMVPVGELTRCTGDALAAVAAESIEIAEKAISLIEVKYEVYESITDPFESMKKDAPPIHEGGNVLTTFEFSNGNPSSVIASAEHVLTADFVTPFNEHAFLEPESAIAFYEDKVLNVLVAAQDIYHNAKELINILAIEPENLRVRSAYVGGAFGGKEDLTVQHFVALLTQLTKRPVKLTLTRQESLRVHPKRHPMNIRMTLACDGQGNFLGLDSRIISDTGAYASLGAGVLRRACTHCAGPYRMPHISIEGHAIYTNNPPAGAFRGFGVTQVTFAMESMIDLMAQKMGVDRWDLRYQNALDVGDIMPLGQICGPDTACRESLELIRPFYQNALAEGRLVGLACGYKSCGIGNGLDDIGRVELKIQDGRVIFCSSAQCIGQGLQTIMAQIVAEYSGWPFEKIDFIAPDTAMTPAAGPTTASRQTRITGEAARIAALSLRQHMMKLSEEELEGRCILGEFSDDTDPVNAPDREHPKNHSSYSYAANLVILNDEDKIDKIVAVHDVGKVINPVNVEGQIEGGVVMGMGFALTEEFLLKDGYLKSKFGTLGILRSTEIPPIEVLLVDKKLDWDEGGPKGIGEVSAIPITAAIANAYLAKDGQARFTLPLEGTPYSRKRKPQ